MKMFILFAFLLTIAGFNAKAEDHKHTEKTSHNHKHEEKQIGSKADDSDKMCLDCGKKESECSCEKHEHEKTKKK